MKSSDTSFPASIGSQPRVLILGSLPGQVSLKAQQYYAHPRNLFWHFMEDIFAIEKVLAYERRLEALNLLGIALWDVIYSAHRPGSLDSNINSQSITPNDIAGLLIAQPQLRTIICNGNKAEELLQRHVLKFFGENLRDELTIHKLPSTSPANASIKREDKLRLWTEALKPFAIK